MHNSQRIKKYITVSDLCHMKKLASVYNCKIQLIFYIVLRLVIYCIVIIIMTRMMINKRYSFAAAYISFYWNQSNYKTFLMKKMSQCLQNIPLQIVPNTKRSSTLNVGTSRTFPHPKCRPNEASTLVRIANGKTLFLRSSICFCKLVG